MSISGIGKLDRERITALLRQTKQTISIAEASTILSMTNQEVSKLLARWTKKGWMARIKGGLYVSIPLESEIADIPLEDAWVIAEKIYAPCYIAGWSAAAHWGLTEQIFRTVVVFTTQRPITRSPSFKGTQFLLHTLSEEALFGLKVIWRGQVKVLISDPTRTILDCLALPKFFGGMQHGIDLFKAYLKSDYKDLGLLIEYGKRLNNKAIFKRLGFLLEQYAPQETDLIQKCREEVSISKTKLDPTQLQEEKLITRWRLWIPKNWAA